MNTLNTWLRKKIFPSRLQGLGYSPAEPSNTSSKFIRTITSYVDLLIILFTGEGDRSVVLQQLSSLSFADISVDQIMADYTFLIKKFEDHSTIVDQLVEFFTVLLQQQDKELLLSYLAEGKNIALCRHVLRAQNIYVDTIAGYLQNNVYQAKFQDGEFVDKKLASYYYAFLRIIDSFDVEEIVRESWLDGGKVVDTDIIYWYIIQCDLLMFTLADSSPNGKPKHVMETILYKLLQKVTDSERINDTEFCNGYARAIHDYVFIDDASFIESIAVNTGSNLAKRMSVRFGVYQKAVLVDDIRNKDLHTKAFEYACRNGLFDSIILQKSQTRLLGLKDGRQDRRVKRILMEFKPERYIMIRHNLKQISYDMYKINRVGTLFSTIMQSILPHERKLFDATLLRFVSFLHTIPKGYTYNKELKSRILFKVSKEFAAHFNSVYEQVGKQTSKSSRKKLSGRV